MIELTGPNLNKRHQELNMKVIQSIKDNVKFEYVKDKEETSDVDKLYKIGIASKYKNIDYILDMLKCGDSLYISKALNCDWFFDDEFALFINPIYLDQYIFPFMSRKMKKKVLATTSLHLRNSVRVEEFYHYCISRKMYHHAMNFLLYTNESFKNGILTQYPMDYHDFNKNTEYLERFIGNSFVLAEQYLEVVEKSNRQWALHKLRYLFSISQEQYLNLLETYHRHSLFYCYSKRLSRSIMKKHKERVLRDPLLYLKLINKNILLEYSTSEDAKVYAVAFFPKTCSEFWEDRYYQSNIFYLNLIPIGEKFSFLRNIFAEKYPGEVFEDNRRFYFDNYYSMMSQIEKEEWALRQIASGNEVHGYGNDYVWYRFINFQQSFVELKKYILISPDHDKRTKILEALVESTKTQEELTILLEYYYNRHINVLEEYKRRFLNKIIQYYDVLQFTDECWQVFNKILYSLDIYNKLNISNHDIEYKKLSLKYHIIHEKSVPEVFYNYIIGRKITIGNMKSGFRKDVDSKKLDLIFVYMLSCFTKHVQQLMDEKTEYNIHTLGRYILDILDLVVDFDKTIEDIPEFVKNYVMTNMRNYGHHRLFPQLLDPSEPEFCMRDIIHYLKKDASLVVSEFDKIKNFYQESSKYDKRNINWLIRKLKIYFYYDVAQEYIHLMNECLSSEDLCLSAARVAVYGIFNLSGEEYKINFLKRYVPLDPKIDHGNISPNLLTIQTAICSMACQARPPLPLSSFRDYIKGDYLQYCISIFDSYLAHLTPDKCTIFVESILDSPVSVQKHGIRLAFHCFSLEALSNLILKVWKNLKNVSLRKILYKATFDKIYSYSDNETKQLGLCNTLTVMTNSLHQDDDEEVYNLLVKTLPSSVFGKHLENAYKVVSEFPQRGINFERSTTILYTMNNNIQLISEDFLRNVIEDTITSVLDQNLMWGQELKDGQINVINAKLSLIQSVVIKQKNILILDTIMDKCFSNWHKTHNSTYVYKKFLINFLDAMESLKVNTYFDHNDIFRHVLKKMEKSVPGREVYLNMMKYKVNIITRQVLGEMKENDSTEQILMKFSLGIRDLMKEYVEQRMFYKSFLEIKTIVENAIWRLVGLLRKEDNEIIEESCTIVLCSTLSKVEDRDIHLFIMELIPHSYQGLYSHEYRSVIDKLLSLHDEEIEYFMYYKFNGSDFSLKDFLPE